MKNLYYPFILLVAAGCAAPEMPGYRMAMGVPHGKIQYQPVKAENIELKLFGKSSVRAGRTATLTFALVNSGTRQIAIPEWYSSESDNIILLVQPWMDGMVEPDESKWIRLDFEYKQPVFHYPLTLMPGNQVLIAKELDFVKNLVIPPGMERRFFVRAELTLSSLKLSSKDIMLTVLPAQVIK